MSKRHVVWDFDLRAWRDHRTGHYWLYHRYSNMWMAYQLDEIEWLRKKITYHEKVWVPGVGVFP